MSKFQFLFLLISFLCISKVINSQASSSQNYVIINTVKQAGVTTEEMVSALPIAIQGKSQVVTYFDGLGRSLQTVMTQAGASQKDIVAGNEYDSYGREVRKYLPYADIAGATNAGSYRPGWKATQASYYNGQLKGVDADIAPWTESVVEPSPLNRILAQGAPGTIWQPNQDDPYDASKKTVQWKYEVNTADDKVRLFKVSLSTGDISSTGFYESGSLTIKVSVDEHGGIVKEFTDKRGQLVLKQVYIEAEVLQTYYIYDDLDLLRAVIQPEGVAAIPVTGAWTPDVTFKRKWMFQYTYDNRNRLVTKIVPGADAVYMMYDKWDRLVLTQDGNLRVAKKWLYTKYDALNRPIMTGVIPEARSQSLIQTSINAGGRFETVKTSAAEGYTLTGCFPSSASYSLTIYTVTHYDSYSNLPSWSSAYAFVNENGAAVKNNILQGQVVATQTRIINTSNWIRSVVYYDDKYRVIQITADNGIGKDRITKVLSFDGKPLQEYQSHTSKVYSTALVQKRTYSYDHADRLLKLTHKIGSGEEIVLTENSYNELGQLLTKKLHQSKTFTSPLQKLDYAYNIRGWLNGVNKPKTTASGYEESDLFSFELHYNTTDLQGSTAQFNGNIAEQIWKGGYDEYMRGYKYSYDKANRLRTSDYAISYSTAATGATWDFSKKYNENIFVIENGTLKSGYDKNGNIKHLERSHGSFDKVDDLNYGNYDGNKLGKVDDNVTANLPVGFTDKSNGANDYSYDANGNMTADFNKGIIAISYNHLNLPVLVDMGTEGTIAYLYDAAGNKLQKTVTDKSVMPNKITITKYAGGFVYTNSYLSSSTVPTETLELIAHEEGRIRPAKVDATKTLTAANTKYIYDYFMKDHLGNTRMVLTTEQQTDIYAATQDSANAAKEIKLFKNISNTTNPKPNGFDGTSTNVNVSRVNGSLPDRRVGPSIILKVMAGDVVTVSTQAWYSGGTQAPIDLSEPIRTQLLSLLSNGIAAGSGTHGGTIASSELNDGAAAVLDDQLLNRGYDNKRPKAFLNWLIVDEEFKKVNSSFHTGAVQVPLISGSTQKQRLTGPANLKVRRNGWLYVYVSNESNQNVYFDDLTINHKRGPVIEQNNYYAFGLEIPGLNSKALGFGGSENRYKYNGKELQSKEFSDGSGLTWSDYGARDYDPQIARWTTIDPKAEKYFSSSPYDFVDNDPVSRVDPTGKDWFNYQGKDDKEKTWHWQKGHKATYVNADGKSVTTKQGYQYLVTFTYDKGHTSEGAKRGTLTVYNQNKVAQQSTAFSGAGLLTGNFDAAAKGNYTMNLSQRSVMPKSNYNSDNDNANPPSNTGMQKIENGTVVHHPDGSTDDVNSDYGNYRIRLNPTDGSRDRGLYLHGKDRWYNSRTHGCVCEKDQSVLEYIWEHTEINGKVPFAIDEPHDTPKQ